MFYYQRERLQSLCSGEEEQVWPAESDGASVLGQVMNIVDDEKEVRAAGILIITYWEGKLAGLTTGEV